MTKQDFIAKVASKSGLSSRDAGKAVDAFMESVKLLANAAAAERPDLLLTGLQSDDLGSGQTGVVVAELIGATHSTIIMHVEVQPSGIRVKCSALNLSIHPSCQITLKFGASKAALGIVSDASMKIAMSVRPRKRYLAKA